MMQTMSTLDSILGRIRKDRARLERIYGVRRIALFGSCARRQDRPGSDVDILVDVPPSIGLGLVDLAEDLEQMLDRRVDVTTFRSVKPSLRSRIEQDLIDA